MYEKYDPKLQKQVYTIYPGEYFYTRDDILIYTVLGSCISVCLYDSQNRIGGMNHFMLAGIQDLSQMMEDHFEYQNTRYGMAAMEVLINSIMKRGGHRKNFRAKVFGGANMIKLSSTGVASVAENNIDFAKWFLKSEEIPIDSIDVGGDRARKVYFNPFDGKAFVKHIIPTTETLSQELAYEKQVLSHKKAEKKEGDIELF